MRHTIMLLLAAPILFGCLSPVDPVSMQDDGTAGSGNNAPSIAGNPWRGIRYDEMYFFEPVASDADGDILTFSLENKPNWANFDASTGRIDGQPTLGNIGVYENIKISVSDGTSSASLPAFSVTVSQTADGLVTLSWVAPSENSDGSPLMDLAGYTIYYRKTPGAYTHEFRIENPGTTTFVVEQLSPATYYFAATAFNSMGVESDFSGEAIRTVN